MVGDVASVGYLGLVGHVCFAGHAAHKNGECCDTTTAAVPFALAFREHFLCVLKDAVFI